MPLTIQNNTHGNKAFVWTEYRHMNIKVTSGLRRVTCAHCGYTGHCGMVTINYFKLIVRCPECKSLNLRGEK